MTPPVFFYDVGSAQAGDVVVLGGEEGRHAADVRRLRVGERLDLTDGAGLVLRAFVNGVRRGELAAEVEERVVAPPSPLQLTVVQALARGGRDEDAVEAMTEVGVDVVVGWQASRNVAQWTDRTAAKWRSTSRAAAKQSRRVWWPSIVGPATTTDVAQLARNADLAVVLHESAPSSLAALTVPAAGTVVVVVGPEGGITDDELETFSGAGAHVVRLGETVLRSSTAGVAALSVISARTRWALGH